MDTLTLKTVSKVYLTRVIYYPRCVHTYLRFLLHPPDWYWIDPNLGMPDDAVFVFCNLTNSGETCIFPDVQSTRMPHIPWEKTPESKKREVWFSSFRQGFKV